MRCSTINWPLCSLHPPGHSPMHLSNKILRAISRTVTLFIINTLIPSKQFPLPSIVGILPQQMFIPFRPHSNPVLSEIHSAMYVISNPPSYRIGYVYCCRIISTFFNSIVTFRPARFPSITYFTGVPLIGKSTRHDYIEKTLLFLTLVLHFFKDLDFWSTLASFSWFAKRSQTLLDMARYLYIPCKNLLRLFAFRVSPSENGHTL